MYVGIWRKKASYWENYKLIVNTEEVEENKNEKLRSTVRPVQAFNFIKTPKWHMLYEGTI